MADHDLASTDQAHNGRSSLRARLDKWGAVSFGHLPFPSYSYYFLEFTIRSSGETEPLLWAYFHDREGKSLVRAVVNDNRYIEGGRIEPGRWKHVSIPLADLGAARRFLSRFSLQDRSGGGTTTFWVDDLRIVGAKWREERPRPSKQPLIR